MKILIAFLLLLASAIDVKADAYRDEVRTNEGGLLLAQKATLCNLRSERWFNAFFSYYQGYMTYLSNHYHIDAKTGDNVVLTLAPEIQASLNKKYPTCSSLFNNPIMSKMDRVHDEITGGYR